MLFDICQSFQSCTQGRVRAKDKNKRTRETQTDRQPFEMMKKEKEKKLQKNHYSLSFSTYQRQKVSLSIPLAALLIFDIRTRPNRVAVDREPGNEEERRRMRM